MQRRTIQRSDPRYRHLRARNNDSVKKSREKSRREREETIESIKQLEEENESLLRNLQAMKQEYEQLQNMFKQYTGIDIEQMAQSERKTTSDLPTSSSIQPIEQPNDSSSKTVLTINTTEDQSSSSNEIDAHSLDGSIVLINGVQYKIVKMNKN